MPVSATTIRTVLLRNGFRPAPPTGLGHLASLSAAIASSPVPSTTSAADGVQIINAFAERWVPTMRHYNDERPHRSLALRPPRGIDIGVAPGGLRSPPGLGAGIASAAWFTSTTRSRHDVRVSEPNGRSTAQKSDGRTAVRRRADDADLGRGTGPPGARQGNRARRDHRRPTRRRGGPAPGTD